MIVPKVDLPHDIERRAYEAYQRHCMKRGVLPDVPLRPFDIHGAFITLRNAERVLIRYRWTGKRLLRMDEAHCKEGQ